jgi:adenylate kinase
MEKRILILGPQGSGKGTQANLLSEKLGIPALSMGQILRDEIASESELGKELAVILNAGNLVSDEMALRMLKGRLSQDDVENGYILDGYPRTKEQYEASKELEPPTDVLLIDVPREESMERLKKRAELEGRVDDTEEVIKHRLDLYEKETEPLLALYEDAGLLKRIDGVGSVEDIHARVMETLS